MQECLTRFDEIQILRSTTLSNANPFDCYRTSQASLWIFSPFAINSSETTRLTSRVLFRFATHGLKSMSMTVLAQVCSGPSLLFNSILHLSLVEPLKIWLVREFCIPNVNTFFG